MFGMSHSVIDRMHCVVQYKIDLHTETDKCAQCDQSVDIQKIIEFIPIRTKMKKQYYSIARAAIGSHCRFQHLAHRYSIEMI